ncbi:MAG: XisI protein [Acidobacteria bacterium]|nr:XisI protein [Acidobacteriota bacterium]MBA4183417.1 XisI protein [Acidobacteriota bacterium]
MDKLEKYRNLIEKILTEHASEPYSYGDIKSQTIFDRERDQYLLVDVGWNNKRFRVHGALVHVEIIDGKFWIQYDGIEDGITTDLELAGVPKSDIVLAFHAPELRKYTDYAVA